MSDSIMRRFIHLPLSYTDTVQDTSRIWLSSALDLPMQLQTQSTPAFLRRPELRDRKTSNFGSRIAG
jgi:hypothetical protein